MKRNGMIVAEEIKTHQHPFTLGPFPFTTEGVRAAFRLQESRHIHGKVVIETAKN